VPAPICNRARGHVRGVVDDADGEVVHARRRRREFREFLQRVRVPLVELGTEVGARGVVVEAVLPVAGDGGAEDIDGGKREALVGVTFDLVVILPLVHIEILYLLVRHEGGEAGMVRCAAVAATEDGGVPVAVVGEMGFAHCFREVDDMTPVPGDWAVGKLWGSQSSRISSADLVAYKDDVIVVCFPRFIDQTPYH